MTKVASAAHAQTITPDWTVDEVVTRYPQTALVFLRRRMHCVGCCVSRFETLADACRVYDEPLGPLLVDLAAQIKQP